MATRYADLDNDGQMSVEDNLTNALHDVGIYSDDDPDFRLFDCLVAALDECVDTHNAT